MRAILLVTLGGLVLAACGDSTASPGSPSSPTPTANPSQVPNFPRLDNTTKIDTPSFFAENYPAEQEGAPTGPYGAEKQPRVLIESYTVPDSPEAVKQTLLKQFYGAGWGGGVNALGGITENNTPKFLPQQFFMRFENISKLDILAYSPEQAARYGFNNVPAGGTVLIYIAFK